MQSAHGVRSNRMPLTLAARIFAGALRAARYDTALVGEGLIAPTAGLTIGLHQPGGLVVSLNAALHVA